MNNVKNVNLRAIKFNSEEYVLIQTKLLGDDHQAVGVAVNSSNPLKLKAGEDEICVVESYNAMVCTDMIDHKVLMLEFNTTFFLHKNVETIIPELKEFLESMIEDPENYRWGCSVVDDSDILNPIEHRVFLEDFTDYLAWINLLDVMSTRDFNPAAITKEMVDAHKGILEFSTNSVSRSEEFKNSLPTGDTMEVYLVTNDGVIDIRPNIMSKDFLVTGVQVENTNQEAK